MSFSQTLVRGWAAALLACCAGAFVSCSAKEDEAKGTEGAACYENGTCNAGLTCASNRCVQLPGGGTGGGQGSGGTGVSGSLGSGGSNMSGGTQGTGGAGATGGGLGSGGNGGTEGSGGTTGGGQGTGGTGGSAGTTGAGGCGGGNCPGTCTNGRCDRQWGECLAPNTGHTTCNGYCTSLGETCAGCPQTTLRAWRFVNDGFCQAGTFPDAQSLAEGCGRIFDWEDNVGPLWSNIQCCCTKTR